MPIKCECGATLNLPNVGATRCGKDFDQIQAAAFVDLDNMPMVGQSGSQTSLFLRTNICDKSNWDSLLAADTPNVTVSPELFNVSTTPGGEQTWEGNDGVQEHVDTDPTEITMEMRHCQPACAKALQQMRCLAQSRRLGVVFFDGAGNVIGVNGTVSAESDAVMPIEVRSIFVADRNFSGRTEPDYYQMTLRLEGEWSLDLAYEECDKNGSADVDWRGVDLIA